MDEMEYFWDTTKSYVTDGKGELRSQEEPPLSAAYERAREDGWLYEDEEGNLRLTGDEEDVELEWDKLREPLLPTVYYFELPPYPSMRAYRSGSMTQLSICYKSPEKIAAETEQYYLKKKKRQPKLQEIARAVANTSDWYVRFKDARPFEMYVAQLLWNDGFTPFLDSAEIPFSKESLKEDQTDIYVAGKHLEVKSHFKFFHPEPSRYPVDLLEDGGIFVCNEKSIKNQKQPRDFYILVSKSYLAWQYEKEMAGDKVRKKYTPLVLPFTPDAWKVGQKTDHQRGYSYNAYFAKPKQLISWKEFTQELRNHYHQQKLTSQRLPDTKTLSLFYPHLDQQEHQQKLEQEHARLLRHQQKVNDDFDF